MKEFWDWMKKNGYGYEEMYIQILDYSDNFCEMPKQMLIGYMIEYLLTKNTYCKIGTNEHEEENIDQYYNRLIKWIENLYYYK